MEEIPRGFIPVPTQYAIYNSYAVDPTWQIKFTIIWTSVLAFSTLVSIPYVYRSAKSGRLYSGLAISEEMKVSQSDTLSRPTRKEIVFQPRRNGFFARGRRTIGAVIQSLSLWTFPMPNLTWWKGQVGDCCRRAYFTLGFAQITLVAAYMGAVAACIVVGAELVQNPNRPGFIALATLPVIMLLSLKSPLPLPVFLPTLSYEHYNFMHRWAGRTLFIAVTVHGGMWLNQFLVNNEHDQITADKTKRGILAYALMGMVVITSLKPVRRRCYQIFWAAHVMFFVGFFAAISYHTPYSRPWVYPCAAIYAYDLLVRMFRYRIKDATLIPVDDTLTMIHIPDCDAGWLPTQHVFVRVLRGSGVFESHPFTITNAPSTPFSASPRGIILYAKVCGDWTRKLHNMAQDVSLSSLEIGDDVEEREAFLSKQEEGQRQGLKRSFGGLDHPGKHVQVVIDGPYGGLKMDLGEYENVLLVGGGSGVTFILGGIEEALRVREKGRGPSKVDVAWVVKDLSTIEALSPTLLHLHNLSLRLSLTLTYNLYLTDPPHPLPASPAVLPSSTTLSPYRPEVAQLVREALPLPRSVGSSTRVVEEGFAETESESPNTPDQNQMQEAQALAQSHPHPHPHGQISQGHAGGLAVVACGPEGIVMEAKNAVANLGIAERVKCGGVAFHGECYAL